MKRFVVSATQSNSNKLEELIMDLNYELFIFKKMGLVGEESDLEYAQKHTQGIRTQIKRILKACDAIDKLQQEEMYIMKKVIRASYSNTSTRDRISNLEERAEWLKNDISSLREMLADPSIPRYNGESDEDIEDRIMDRQQDLAEVEEQLNFAWQDDEAEWDYAREQQEFNPDGSLALYSSTKSSKRKAVKAASGVVTDAERAVDYANALMELGVDEHDILIHFFDYLPSSKVIEILKDLAVDCDCEEEVEEIVNGGN